MGARDSVFIVGKLGQFFNKMWARFLVHFVKGFPLFYIKLMISRSKKKIKFFKTKEIRLRRVYVYPDSILVYYNVKPALGRGHHFALFSKYFNQKK